MIIDIILGLLGIVIALTLYCVFMCIILFVCKALFPKTFARLVGPNTSSVKVVLELGAKAPARQTDGSAGWDLYAYLKAPVTIAPGKQELIPVGFSMQMPSNLEAQIRPRSSTSMRLINIRFGTIDSDYRGPVKVFVHNESAEDIVIENDMRIAQLIFSTLPKVQLSLVQELDMTDRGTKGFGSTGGL